MSSRAWSSRVLGAAVSLLVATMGAVATDVAVTAAPAAATGTNTTTFTAGNFGAYILPGGFRFLRVLIIGGQGGGNTQEQGGRGAAITLEVPYSAVPQGFVYVTVGENGATGTNYVGNGFLTGGAGGTGDLGRIGYQGGSASGIFVNCTSGVGCATPLVIAGGGGGAGPYTNFDPGDAGMPGGSGSSGWTNLVDTNAPLGGGGGSQTGPGGGGQCCMSRTGDVSPPDPRVGGEPGGVWGGFLGAGSNGGAGGTSLAGTFASGGAGGGGGYFGGGGGAGRITKGDSTFQGAGGGGGSSYVTPSATVIAAHVADRQFHPGDENNNPSPRIEITPFNAPATVAVTCAVPVRYAGGVPIPCTATVTGPPGAAAPTGTITWSSFRVPTGFSPATCTLDANGSCTVTFNTPSGFGPLPGVDFPAGYDISPHYGGDANYLFADTRIGVNPVLEFLGAHTLTCTPATTTIGTPVTCRLYVEEFPGQYGTSFSEHASFSVTGGTGTISPNPCTFTPGPSYYNGSCDVTFTPSSAGTLTLRAVTDTTQQTTVTLNVSPALTGVDVTPTAAQLPKGTTRQFTATAHFSDGSTSDVTNAATWSSDDASVIVDASGLATAAAIGSANVSASYRGLSASAAVQVAPPALASIEVAPPTAEIPIGSSQPFGATGHYTDGSTADITSSVTWSTDAVSHLSVDSTGLATGLSAGTSPVIATLAGKVGSALLIVDVDQPTIAWANPADITYGVALSASQLNSTASYNGQPVAGTFSYAPDLGTVLHAGAGQTLHVAFTPSDPNTFAGANATATINVNPATPTITWANPADITYGTALDGTQLNAVAPVAGTFSYTPDLGTVLEVGSRSLSVTFTPNSADFTAVTTTVTINVLKITPTITWGTPAPIIVGTALGTVQLNATASVAGTVAYTPKTGTVLGAGSQTLSVTFTPTDTAHYSNATATRTIRVLYAGAGTLCLGAPGHQVLAPVDADGSNVFKGGSTIAVQFRVCNASGASIGTPGVVTSFSLGSTAMANGFNWDPKIRAWTMVLSTKTLATGPKYTGTISLNDGTSITFTFTLR